MADNVTLNSGSGGAVMATDDVAGVHYQRVKLVDGTLEGTGAIGGDATNGLDVDVTRVQGTVAVTQSGTWDEVGINDSGNSITVDWAGAAPPIGAGVEATALRVTVATDSTGVLSVDDNGGSLTVDVGTALPAGTNNIGDVDVLSVVPGTGATNLGKAVDSVPGATDTGVAVLAVRDDATATLTPVDGDYTHLRVNARGGLWVDLETRLDSTNDSVNLGGTSLTALQLIDDPVFADDAAFTLASSKVSMAGAIRDDSLSTLTAVEGDAVPLRVSATGALHVTGGGGGTEYTEDAPAAADPVANALILVRNDTPSTTTVSLDGDNIAARSNSAGAQYVELLSGAAKVGGDATNGLDVDVTRVSGNVTVVQATSSNLNVTEASAGTIASNTTAISDKLTNIQYNEDSIHSDTNIGVFVLGVRRDTTDSGVNASGDYASLNVNSVGRLWTSSTVDAALPAGTNNIGDVDVLTVPAPLSTTGGGTEATALRVTVANDSTGVLSVDDNGGSLTVDYATTGSGTATGALRVELANNGTGQVSTVSTVTTVSTLTGGGVAHDGADSGNPLKVGMKAKSSLTGITLVAADDRTDTYADVDGVPIVKIGMPSGNQLIERVSNTDGASTAFSTFGAAANLRNFITSVTIHNAHATTNGFVDFRDGTAGSIIWTFPAPATGGVTHTFNPPLRQPTANTALAFDPSAAITTLYISVAGFQSKA